MLSSLIVCNSDKPFSDQTETWWKWILCNNQTTSDNQLSGWTEKRSQSQICMKKRSWSLFSGLLSVWSTTASESWQNHYIWEVNSGNWWDPPKTAMPTVSIHQEKGPDSYDNIWMPVAQPTLLSWMNWAIKFCLIHHVLLTNWLPLLQESLFLQRKCIHNQQKMLSKSSLNPKAWSFTLQE